MMNMVKMAGSTALAILLAAGPSCADLLVIPQSGASMAGPDLFARTLDTQSQTSQYVYAGSLLSGLGAGNELTGIAFRLFAGEYPSPPSPALNYADFEVTISRSNFAPGSLSSTFADNIGPDAVLARSGPLTVAAGAFPSGGSPNAFGPIIAFSTPYDYTGGDLLITVRHDDPGATIYVDGTDTTGLQSVGAAGAESTKADFNRPIAPIIELRFQPVPEPPSLALAVIGAAGTLGLVARRRLSIARI